MGHAKIANPRIRNVFFIVLALSALLFVSCIHHHHDTEVQAHDCAVCMLAQQAGHVFRPLKPQAEILMPWMMVFLMPVTIFYSVCRKQKNSLYHLKIRMNI